MPEIRDPQEWPQQPPCTPRLPSSSFPPEGAPQLLQRRQTLQDAKVHVHTDKADFNYGLSVPFMTLSLKLPKKPQKTKYKKVLKRAELGPQKSWGGRVNRGRALGTTLNLTRSEHRGDSAHPKQVCPHWGAAHMDLRTTHRWAPARLALQMPSFQRSWSGSQPALGTLLSTPDQEPYNSVVSGKFSLLTPSVPSVVEMLSP